MSSDSEREPPSDLGTFHTIRQDEEDWLDTNHRENFLNAVGTKGKVEGSVAEHTQTTIVPEFLAYFYPSSTEMQRSDMANVAYSKIYAYLINGKRPGSGSKKKRRTKAQRVDVTLLWAESDPEIKSKLFHDYRTANGIPADKTIPVQVSRKLICDAYRALSKEVKQDWERRAAELRQELAKPKVLQGEERLNFARRVPGVLKGLFREYEAQGVIVTVYVAYQIEDVGTMEVTSVSSDAAKEYKCTDGHADSVATYADWLRTQGKTVKRDIPIEMAYPDRQNECMPLIPDINYDKPPPVPVLCRIVRTAVSALNQRLGGTMQFPWTEVQRAQMNGDFKFVALQRMPPDHPIMDPSAMTSEYALVWVKWLARPQNDDSDKSTWFMPNVVYTGSLNTPLTRSDHVSKSNVVRGNTEVWEIKYGNWVEKCQVGGNIKFPDEAREYEEYLKKQRSARSRPHLLGLPCGSCFVPSPAFSDSDLTFVETIMSESAPSEKDTVRALMDAVNQMYLHLPAKISEEYLSSWVSSDYFAPPFEDIPPHSTVHFFEKWQHWALNKGFLQHLESQTLIGGRSGTLCAVLGILKLTFSIGTLLGKVQLPGPRPQAIDVTRVSQADWDRCMLWCSDWLKTVVETAATLTATFSERTKKDAPNPQSSCESPRPTSARNSSLESPRSPPPAPAEKLKPRPRPKYISQPVDTPVDKDSWSVASAESAGSDTYQQQDDKASDDASDEDDKKPTKAKGKQPVPTTVSPDIDFGLMPLEKLCDQYERTSVIPPSGRSLTNGSKEPIAEVPLDSHPLGTVLEPRATPEWSGTPYALVQECVRIKKEAKGALLGFFSSSFPSFRPEDSVIAVTATMSAPLPDADKTKLLLLNLQRQSWNRAKDLWATPQYQFRPFSELMEQLSQLVVTVDTERRAASGGISAELRNHMVSLRRLAYEVRFVYQELHDLGFLSRSFFDLLPDGWDNSTQLLSSSELQNVADQVFEWSHLTSKLIRYHTEFRARTWSLAKVDEKKYPMPQPVWLSFGNAPSHEIMTEAIASMSTRIAALQAPTDNDASAKSSSHNKNADPVSNDLEVDSESPSEEELRARQLLEGTEQAGEHVAERQEDSSVRQENVNVATVSAQGGSAQEHNANTVVRDPGVVSPTVPQPAPLPTPSVHSESAARSKATQSTEIQGSKLPKKRKSNPTTIDNSKESIKKSKPAKRVEGNVGPKAKDQGQEATATRRSGRAVKPTEKARNA